MSFVVSPEELQILNEPIKSIDKLFAIGPANRIQIIQDLAERLKIYLEESSNENKLEENQHLLELIRVRTQEIQELFRQ